MSRGFSPATKYSAGARFAEYVSVFEDALAVKPANITLEQAAGFPISAFAALQALRDTGRIQPGHRVLIIGASGGVGTFAVQIAKSFGAEVTGVCSGKNVQMVGSIGADHVIDYARDDFAEGERPYDVILDIAGNRSLSHLRRALTPQGTLVLVGGSGGPWLMGTERTLRALTLSPFVHQRLRGFLSQPKKEDLAVLKTLIEAGTVTPVIDRTYPLSEVPDAMRYVEQQHPGGKLVITM
jgi:NADPH:quinone reductase-like Zn-dependent oxidoreductase